MVLADSNSSSLTRQDLLDLGTDPHNPTSLIAQKLAQISQQLTDLSSTLKEVSHTADTALEASIALQDETR